MLELTPYVVESWIKTTPTGEFHYTKVLDGQVKASSYAKLRKIMFELCHAKEPVVEPCGRRDGVYRLISEVPKPIDWQGIDASKDFPIALPFDLRKYVWIDPETSIIVAGDKDSGKTGLIMLTVAMNMNKVNTIFLSNMEGGVNQIKRRFDAMDIEIPRPAPFEVYHIIDNFHDAIKQSDTLYAIDYIDVPESGEFYMIAPALAKIEVKLQGLNSVAMIGLQKRTNSDLAYGGGQTIKKAGLYLAMGVGKLKIVSAKIPSKELEAQHIHPKNMQWTFTYDNKGTKFTNIQRCYGNETN